MDAKQLPHEIQDLPELFQRMYEAAPAEIVPLEWVARQAGYRNVGSIHNKISEGCGPISFISGKRRVCDRKDAVLWISPTTVRRLITTGRLRANNTSCATRPLWRIHEQWIADYAQNTPEQKEENNAPMQTAED